MSSYLSWEHQFCLACDSQTDGATYCSESCRLSDFEKSSSAPTTPTVSNDAPNLQNQAKLYLTPAYDFHNAQPYGSNPSSMDRSHLPELTAGPPRVLTPSSSHSSLCSLQSNSSAGSDSSPLSDKARKQLRDYASSFEHARLQRRRSS